MSKSRVGEAPCFILGSVGRLGNLQQVIFRSPDRRFPAAQLHFHLAARGPSHHDLWDPKPRASAEIRGPFETIPTSQPGTHLGELMENTARVSDRLCLVRSMTHQFNNHIAGTYIALTGSANQPNQDHEAPSDDSPGPGAILNYLGPTAPSVPRSVSLPVWLVSGSSESAGSAVALLSPSRRSSHFLLHASLPGRRREAMPVTEDDAAAQDSSQGKALQQRQIPREEMQPPLSAIVP